MDLNNVTLEITSLVISFDHYNALVADMIRNEETGAADEFQKITNKGYEHFLAFFGSNAFYDQDHQLKSLSDIKTRIKAELNGLERDKVHELIEKLEKDSKKMRKLYRALQQ